MSVKAVGKQWQVKPRFAGNCFNVGFLLSLLFDPEDGSDLSLRNVD
jgi:hypothetical protein